MTIEDIIKRNKQVGDKFFNRDAIKSFGSRVSETVHEGPGGIYFVTSEKQLYSKTPRVYSVRGFDFETGSVKNRSLYTKYDTLRQAQAAAKELAKNGE